MGLTIQHFRFRYFYTVHPHVCGAYDPTFAVPVLLHGSSPRMWGLLQGILLPSEDNRFIPTYVGLTNLLSGTSLSNFGSSPRMWGLRHGDLPTQWNQRFIPTYVGLTRRCHGSRRTSGGSSPRMWGLLLLTAEGNS